MNCLDSLAYVHDELNMTVALMLLHLSYGSKYFYEDNSIAINLIHVAMSICEALNAKDTEVCITHHHFKSLIGFFNFFEID